ARWQGFYAMRLRPIWTPGKNVGGWRERPCTNEFSSLGQKTVAFCIDGCALAIFLNRSWSARRIRSQKFPIKTSSAALRYWEQLRRYRTLARQAPDPRAGSRTDLAKSAPASASLCRLLSTGAFGKSTAW